MNVFSLPDNLQNSLESLVDNKTLLNSAYIIESNSFSEYLRKIRAKIIFIKKHEPPHTCSICLSGINTIVKKTHCGHSYHPACIDKWSRTSSTCPMCRCEIFICTVSYTAHCMNLLSEADPDLDTYEIG